MELHLRNHSCLSVALVDSGFWHLKTVMLLSPQYSRLQIRNPQVPEMDGPKAALIPTLSCHSLVCSGWETVCGAAAGWVCTPGFPEAESRKVDQGQRQKPQKHQKPLRPNLRKSLGSLAISGLLVGICGVHSPGGCHHQPWGSPLKLPLRICLRHHTFPSFM